MEIVLIISQEHKTLPKAEIEAVLKAENVPYDIKNQYDGVLIINIPEKCLKFLKNIVKRFSYTHEVCKLLFETDKIHLNSEIQEYNWNDLLTKDYAVRVKRMDKNDKFDTTEIEWELGGIIKSKVDDVKVNLNDPRSFLRIIFIDRKILVTERLFKVEKKHFYDLNHIKDLFFTRDQ